MSGNKLEQEVKFCLGSLSQLEERLQLLGAELVQPRTYERNLRFDTPDRRLSNAFQVLRLRLDDRVRLTYKGAGDPGQEVSARQEIEVTVSDLKAAREILEALGFEVITVYEKYRAAYQLLNCEVSLDEMPFGHFCEIEGPDADSIQTCALALGLDWQVRSKLSYMALFAALKERLGLAMLDLTFEVFDGIQVTPESMGVVLADLD